ncbi:MAG: GTPase [Bacteroidota bacterium]
MSTLIFIYNANSGKGNAFLDSMHKVFRPETYDCKLCELTFGVVRENRRWKRFRETKKESMLFLHKDEFAKTYTSKFGHKFTFPIVLVEGISGLEVVITTEELNQLETVDSLIQMVEERTL